MPHPSNKDELATFLGRRIMLKAIESNKDPYLGLLEYRNTPIDGEASPAQLLMKRQKQNYDKASKDLIELKDNQPIWVKLSKEVTRWAKGVVTSCIAPRSYLIQAENGRFYCRNRAHLKPRSSAEDNSVQQSSGFTGDEDLLAEFHPPVTQSSSPKKAASKTPDNCSTGEIFQDSPYRTPTHHPAAKSESRNGEDYLQPYVTRTGRVVKPVKIMDI
ncbi:hypothetical protein QYM36_007793 [Artemia franciscana]|uniref:Uncharacterized protein n=1 Tax=Artemia franciscana TaxID=6661 RepID=A0AA88ID47_ARTSF|nr:hypothetical protein QYM36_007793 [Artemia franciscana]